MCLVFKRQSPTPLISQGEERKEKKSMFDSSIFATCVLSNYIFSWHFKIKK